MQVYLASTSPARLALLRQIGIEPVVLPSNVDEDAQVAQAQAERGSPLSADELVLLLARLKAEAVRGPDIDGIILGGDSAFDIGGTIHGKPHTPERATERWRSQRGKAGVLHSGHWVIDHRQGFERAAAGGVDQALVRFADDISDDEIDHYVQSGEPLSVAGSFTIDGLGAPFITEVQGAPSAVIGMSLPLLRRLLAQLEISWTQLRSGAAHSSQ